MIKKISFTLATLLVSTVLHASGTVPYIFNLPTCETSGSGIVLFDVGHRYFDPIKHTTNVNIGLGYGITDWLDILVERLFMNMDTVANLKISAFRDDVPDPYPFSLAFTAGLGYKEDINDDLRSGDRTSFYMQGVFQIHFIENRLSFGVVPTFAYNTNFYTNYDSSYDYSMGGGVFMEFYFFDRFSFCAELIMNLYGFAFHYMNYNVGFKYSGYRHTFSVWISNSGGCSPVEYIVGNTTLEPRPSFSFTREFDL